MLAWLHLQAICSQPASRVRLRPACQPHPNRVELSIPNAPAKFPANREFFEK